MKEIIYLSFYFNSHWCAGVMQIKNDTLTYWKKDRYVAERIVEVKAFEKKRLVRTDKTVLLINRWSVEYIERDRFVKFFRKL
jgi:hypothetical protein